MSGVTLPATIEATVWLVHGLLAEAEQVRITALLHEDLVTLHPGLGLWMRNHLGLWNGNQALRDATGHRDPDEASAVLVEALWQHLQGRRPRLH